MKIVLTPFMYLAALGLILSVMVHVLSLFGLPSPFGGTSWFLHVGIFVVWLPTVLVANTLVKDFKQRDFWKAALRACPKWMKYLTYFFFGYAIFNFALFIIMDVSGGSGKGGGSGTPSNVYRGFSGHWMAFYCVAMAILYSAIHVREHDEARRCPNGHRVGPSAKFCEECGSKIVEPQQIR
jgi:hypothetical protein